RLLPGRLEVEPKPHPDRWSSLQPVASGVREERIRSTANDSPRTNLPESCERHERRQRVLAGHHHQQIRSCQWRSAALQLGQDSLPATPGHRLVSKNQWRGIMVEGFREEQCQRYKWWILDAGV